MSSEYIETLSRASDRYGNPYLLRFMERYHLFMERYRLTRLLDATEEQAREYIREVGLERVGKENHENQLFRAVPNKA